MASTASASSQTLTSLLQLFPNTTANSNTQPVASTSSIPAATILSKPESSLSTAKPFPPVPKGAVEQNLLRCQLNTKKVGLVLQITAGLLLFLQKLVIDKTPPNHPHFQECIERITANCTFVDTIKMNMNSPATSLPSPRTDPSTNLPTAGMIEVSKGYNELKALCDFTIQLEKEIRKQALKDARPATPIQLSAPPLRRQGSSQESRIQTESPGNTIPSLPTSTLKRKSSDEEREEKQKKKRESPPTSEFSVQSTASQFSTAANNASTPMNASTPFNIQQVASSNPFSSLNSQPSPSQFAAPPVQPTQSQPTPAATSSPQILTVLTAAKELQGRYQQLQAMAKAPGFANQPIQTQQSIMTTIQNMGQQLMVYTEQLRRMQPGVMPNNPSTSTQTPSHALQNFARQPIHAGSPTYMSNAGSPPNHTGSPWNAGPHGITTDGAPNGMSPRRFSNDMGTKKASGDAQRARTVSSTSNMLADAVLPKSAPTPPSRNTPQTGTIALPGAGRKPSDGRPQGSQTPSSMFSSSQIFSQAPSAPASQSQNFGALTASLTKPQESASSDFDWSSFINDDT